MKRLCNVSIRLGAALVMVLTATFAARADIDKKFFKKAAQKVWAMDLPQFNPNADLSDSIFQNQSAVYIARYNSLVADYDQSSDASKLRTAGIATSNAIKSTHLRRNMIKLNDASAVEKFTEFSIDAPQKKDLHGFTIIWTKHAFGARIIKPDGTVNEVDINEAVTVTEGKKNEKDSEYKIAIPGLLAGDILDFFYYDEYFLDELSMKDIDVSFLASYPTRNFTIDFRTAPELAVEYGAYNGAPQLTSFTMIEGKNRFFLELENMDSLDEEMPYFKSARQMPFLRFYILNNKARLEFVPKSARPGGIRHTNSHYLLSDIASYMASLRPDYKCADEAASIVNNWLKANGQLSDRQLADLAYMALKYAMIKQGNRYGGLSFALQYYKTLEKLHVQIPYGVGVTSSRNNVPIDKMIRFDEPDYIVMVGDSCYFSNTNIMRLPGEMRESFDRESYWKFNGRPESENIQAMLVNGNLPATNAMANTVYLVSDVSLDTDNDTDDLLSVTTQMTVTGAQKGILTPLVSEKAAITRLEKYLGVKPMTMKVDMHNELRTITARQKFAEKISKNMWGGKDCALKSYTVDSYGVTPDSADVKVTFKGTVQDAVTHAGDNLMVNLGLFISEQQQIKGAQRKRDVSILRDSPERFDITIRFEIPEGYELVPESLEDLNRSIIFKEATFNSSAELVDNTVVVRVTERYPRSIYAPTSWDALMAISDASYEFNSASIVLREK